MKPLFFLACCLLLLFPAFVASAQNIYHYNILGLCDSNEKPVAAELLLTPQGAGYVVEIKTSVSGAESLKNDIILLGKFDEKTLKNNILSLLGDLVTICGDSAEFNSSVKKIYDQITGIPLQELNEAKMAGEIEVYQSSIILQKVEEFISATKTKTKKKCKPKINKEGKENCSINLSQEQEKLNEENPSVLIDQVLITIVDNYIINLRIEGKLKDSNRPFSVYNEYWGISLKSYKTNYFKIKIGEQPYNLCLCDVINIKNMTTYHVKDVQVTLKPGEKQTLYARGLDEYIGINVLSDFLGFNNNNPNNFLSIGAKVTVPLSLRQYRHHRWAEFATADLQMAVLNNVRGVGAYKELWIKNDSLFVDFFDLIRYQNVRTEGYFALYGRDAKKMGDFKMYIGGGYDLYRAGLSYNKISTGKDSVVNFNVVTMGPNIKFVAQYRPNLFYGADLFVKVSYLGMFNTDNNNPRVIESAGFYRHKNYGTQQYYAMKPYNRLVYSAELDLYAHISKSLGKSGIFARLGYDFDMTGNAFPRILIGYSTNLDSYIGGVRDSKQ